MDTAQVTEWRNQRFNWKDIAGFLGTDARRLRRWRVRVFFVEPLDNVEDDELDAYVRDYIDENPTVGEISVDAYLAGVLMLNGHHCKELEDKHSSIAENNLVKRL